MRARSIGPRLLAGIACIGMFLLGVVLAALGAIRSRLLAGVACLGMFLFGVVMALLGAILPLVSARLALDLGQAGQLFLAMNLCMLVVSLAVGPLMDRLGLQPPLVAGPLVTGAAVALIALAPGYGALLAGAALLGAGGGALNASTNTLMADLYTDPARKNAALNLLGVFFGFGALTMPFAIASLLERAGLTAIVLGVAAACTAASMLALVLAFPGPKQAGGLRGSEVARFARMPAVLLAGFLLFFESGNEFILGGYLSLFLTRETGASISAASYLLAGFWASIMVARLLLSRILLRVDGYLLVLLSAGGAAASAALLLGTRNQAACFAAIVLLGVSAAGIYPTILGIAGSRFRENSGAVFGILFAIALAGGMSMPWGVGQLARAHGLRTALWLVVVNFAAVLVLGLAVRRVYRTEPAAAREMGSGGI
ncbi:MAG: MFS transporter [Acidobacteria bacterium]|nr:MFS transporter [Acidobacteriota bacterium]